MPRGAFSLGNGRILLGLASSGNDCRDRLDRRIGSHTAAWLMAPFFPW